MQKKSTQVVAFFICIFIVLPCQATLSEFAGSRAVNRGDTNGSYTLDRNTCPPVLEAWVHDDYEDQTSWGLSYKSEAKTCQTSIESYKSYLNRRGTATSFSTAQNLSEYFQQKFSKQISPYYKGYLDKCDKLSPGKAISAQTKFYSVATKIEAANSTIVDEIVQIDSLLPESPFLDGIECTSAWPAIKSKCELYRRANGKCPISSKEKEFDKLVIKTIDTLPKIEGLVVARHACLEKVAHDTSTAQKKMREGCDRIGAAIEVMRNEIPWVRGSDFEKVAVKKAPNKLFGTYNTEYDLSYLTIAKGLSAQLTSNREALAATYKSNLADFRCMIKGQVGELCDFNKIRTRVSGLPELRNENLFSLKNPQDREASNYFSAEKCIIERHEDRAQTKKIVDDSIKGGVLTVTTFGLGEAVSGIQVLNSTSKLSIARQGLLAANIGLNSELTGEGLGQAYKSCSSERESVIAIIKSNENRVAETCQSSSSGLGQAKEKESSCLIDALLTVPSVLPLVGAIPSVRALLNKSGTAAANVDEVSNSAEAVGKDLETTAVSKQTIKDSQTTSKEVASGASKAEKKGLNSPKVDDLPDHLGMGSKEAEATVKLGESLRARKIDPRKTHIPEFSDQVDKHVDYARKSIGKQKYKDAKERLAILEKFEAEAAKRVKEGNVTYEWWNDFNYRISILMTPKSARTAVSGGAKDKFAASVLRWDRWKTHEGFRVAAAKQKKSFFSEYDEFDVAGAYPKHIVIPTTEGIHGIAALNSTYGSDVSIVGMIGKRIRADGREMYPDHFFRHDHVHVSNENYVNSRFDLTRKMRKDLRQNYLRYRDSVPLSDDRRNAFEFAYFMATHELPGTDEIIRYGGNFTRMTKDDIVKSIRDPDWYASVVPPWASESDAAAKKFLDMSLQELKKFSEKFYKNMRLRNRSDK